ncbi:GDSL-type esterase/lipase family protein [Neorhizobium sp. BT27B]|uniref:GDSL-type esterase/lipase family protein n=1 Tax=Neorhizobium sp. BT27B TaxID=3142625 RepID=UPI003D2BF918
MSTTRILIHGTTAQRMSSTPEIGQIGSDDDRHQVVLGDGVTPGGIGMAKERSAFDSAIVFEGDSVTRGFGLADPANQNLAKLFSQMEWANGYRSFYNFATDGARIDTTISSRYAGSVKPHRPTLSGGDGGRQSYLFLMAGINDLANARTAAQVIADLTSYVSIAISDGFTVIVGTIPPANSFTYDASRQTINRAIRSNAIGASVVYDMEDVLNDAFDTLIFPDGGHPSAIGARLIANYLNLGMLSGGFVIRCGQGALTSAIAAALHSPRFSATLNTSIASGSLASGYDVPEYNDLGCFDATTGRFTADRKGYLVATFTGRCNTPAQNTVIRFAKNGAEVGPSMFVGTAFQDLTLTFTVPVEKGDWVAVYAKSGSTFGEREYQRFSGYMIS